MDGQYRTELKIIASLQSWLKTISRSANAWEGNNLHVDEVATLETLERRDWVCKSFQVFSILLKKVTITNSLIPFLHIVLSDANEHVLLREVSLEWIEDNISEFTPPSFNCTSLEYYNSFYKNELIKTNIIGNSTMFEQLGSGSIRCFYRTSFDELDGIYSRELYFHDSVRKF